MKAEFNISLTFDQIVDLVKQLPGKQKLKLSRELEKEAVNTKLTRLLTAFKTDELSLETIEQEAEAVRSEIYEESKKR
jgi:hypothetical protein